MNANDTDPLASRLEAMVPKRPLGGSEPSATRLYVRAHFDTIASARDRGVTWQQISVAIAEGGVKTTDGDELDWRALKGLYHAERYSRGARRKRRTKKPTPSTVGQTHTPATAAAVTFDPLDGSPPEKPRAKFSPASKPR